MSDFRLRHRLLLLAAIAAAPAVSAARSPAEQTTASTLTPAHAATVFAEAQRQCEADDGRLWGVSLCGPMMFVDPSSHHIITNQADAEDKLHAEQGVFVGSLPPDQPVANTATTWAGVRWTQVLWPLPSDEAKRRILLAHESFHRVQDRVAPIQRAGDNAHLDVLQGRYTMLLEWRALAAALDADNADTRRRHVQDALLFRAARYRQFPKARAAEVALERNEGLAEYTGVMIGADTASARIAAAHRDLASHADDPSFVRSFAYATGPAYGLLLDRYRPGWRKDVGTGAGPAALLAEALHLDLATMPVDALEQRAAQYDGAALLAAETTRQAQRDLLVARYRKALVDGPVLVLPLHMHDMQVQFDPRTLLPLGDAGTVYPTLRASDRWGSIQTDAGALMASGWNRLTVSAPGSADVRDGNLAGDGWTLHLAPGWQLAPGSRPGDYVVQPIAKQAPKE
jgi:hypothetical protein